MTPPEIRAMAIERLAKAQHWRDEYMCLPDDPPPDHWEIADEETRNGYREAMSRHIDALGDMLPTGDEWGWQIPGIPTTISGASHVGARLHIEAYPGDRLVRRWTHDWTEVTD